MGGTEGEDSEGPQKIDELINLIAGGKWQAEWIMEDFRRGTCWKLFLSFEGSDTTKAQLSKHKGNHP